MPAPPFFAQQPRWLLLSVLLFLWSVSSGLRGDGRSRALGLGVDARAHMPVADNPVLEEVSREEPFTVMWKRQGGMPTCAAMCASQASDAVECGDSLNLGCACLSPSFLPDAVGCMDQNCTTLDERLGQMVLQSACQDIATTTAASTTSSGSSMLFSSGTPTVYPTASPTSASATTSVSVTVTVTVTVTLSPPGPPDCPSVVTTTSMLTSRSTVFMATGSTVHPVTTVTSTSTLASGQASGAVGDLNPTSTDVGGGEADGAVSVTGGVGAAVVAALSPLLGMAILWMV